MGVRFSGFQALRYTLGGARFCASVRVLLHYSACPSLPLTSALNPALRPLRGLAHGLPYPAHVGADSHNVTCRKNRLDRLSTCHWGQSHYASCIRFTEEIAEGQGAAVSNRRRTEKVRLEKEGFKEELRVITPLAFALPRNRRRPRSGGFQPPTDGKGQVRDGGFDARSPAPCNRGRERDHIRGQSPMALI